MHDHFLLSSQSLEDIKLLLDRYKSQRQATLERIKQLVTDFDLDSFYRKERETYQNARVAIDRFIASGLYNKTTSFDLFKVLHFIPSENQISNVVASILDPCTSPWGKSIIRALITETDQSGALLSSYHKILELLDSTPPEKILVSREWKGDLSRIDIRVVSRNLNQESNFVIDIEMKVEGGSETLFDNEAQTHREWKDLLAFASTNHIPNDNIIAFFISPRGSRAESEHFYCVASERLNKYILNAVGSSESEYKDPFTKESAAAISHFFRSGWIF
jgi:hypothetical protein